MSSAGDAENAWFYLARDIDSRLDAELREEIDAEAEDLRVAEEAALTLGMRIRGSIGRGVSVTVAGTDLDGMVEEAGDEWFTVRGAGGVSVIRTRGVSAVRGLSLAVDVRAGVLDSLGFGAVLRRLARGNDVVCWTSGAQHTGVLTRVGADHVDLVGPAGNLCLTFEALVRVDVK